ncbi:MAG: phosphotransferase family protein [Halobacteriales archaeon]
MTVDAEVTAADVAGMVRACRPGWCVVDLERSDAGTDFVCSVTCESQDGEREAVLKATTAGLVDPAVARAEPRLLELVGRETTIPVPAVYGFVDAHADYPAPFSLLERVDGVNLADDPGQLPGRARERVVREAGRYLAALHELGTLPRVGTVGVRDGELAVVDGERGPVDGPREWLRAGADRVLDALADGTFFPELADEPDRFADLVPELREALDARIAALPEPDPPRYCHWDYRYGNLLVDPETGETRAVLDWANLRAAEPAYNLAVVERKLFDPHRVGGDRARELREAFHASYRREREDWAFTPAVEARMKTYRLLERLGAMACLPLWMRDATAAERAAREREHREAVAELL